MDEMRLFLKPRQIGHFFLWLAKYHPDLETEQVLASSTAVLKSE
jgi:hypothetical protein